LYERPFLWRLIFMAAKNTHAAAGAIVGLGIYALFKYIRNERWTLEGALASTAAGAVFACLPDIIEPALHPNHRGLFHSCAAIGAISYASERIVGSVGLTQDARMGVSVFSAAYISHLLIDAMTPKGLPLLGIRSVL
jgi:membrane-bound metal-dependent hydrolase YbcI (DUF457 family)